MALRVGVKFCGNCNPLVDMPSLLKELSILAEDINFVHWEDASYGVLLILSGCGTDCATRPPIPVPLVVATNESVNHWPVTATDLPVAILTALKKFNTKK